MNNTSMDPLQDISSTVDLLALADGPVTKSCICFPLHKIDYLDDDELSYLMCSYSTFLEGVAIASGTVIFDHYASVEFCGDRYGSLDSRSERSSYVIAFWVGIDGSIDPATVDARLAIVHYYLKQNIVIHGELKSIVMARVSCFQKHPDRHKPESGITEIWCKDVFEPFGPASFIPMQVSLELCKHGKEKMYCSFCLLKRKFICEENEQSTLFHLQCGGLFIKQRLKTVLGLFFIN